MARQRPLGLIVLAVVATLGCGDGTSPSAEREVSVGFCSPPSWFAYRNESGGWTRISPVTNEITFKATRQAAIAFVYADIFIVHTEMLFLSAEQLDAIACATPSPADKRLTGTITGIFSTQCQQPMVKMARQPWQLGPVDVGFYYFSLSSLPDGPHDLIAACAVPSGLTKDIQRLLLRRGVDLPDGAELPRLDMAGPESFAPTVNPIQVSGLDPAEPYTTVHHTFRASGTNFELTATDGTIRTVPLERQLPGDLHELYVDSRSGDYQTFRFVTRFHRAPGDFTLDLGEALTIPTNTVIQDGPYMRIRTTLPSQSAYGSLVTACYDQGNDRLRLIMSRDFVGNIPLNWTIEIPDLTRVAGFVPSWGLQTGTYGWRVEALELPPTYPILPLFHGISDWKPQDGDVIHGATRQSPEWPTNAWFCSGMMAPEPTLVSSAYVPEP